MSNPNKKSEMIQTLPPAPSDAAGFLNSPPTAAAGLLDTPPTATATATAGEFNKVSRKPTNRSKSMSRRQRCNCCHDNPVCSKSKNKVKETRKIKNGSGGVGSDLRLVSKRVVDSSPGLHYSGILDDVGEKEKEGVVDENGTGLIGDPEIGSVDVIKDNDDDDKVSFCDVGLVWEDVDEDEGWVKL